MAYTGCFFGTGTTPAIGLHIYQPGRDSLDNAALQQVERLRQRLIIQYGAGHVRDSHPALAP